MKLVAIKKNCFRWSCFFWWLRLNLCYEI